MVPSSLRVTSSIWKHCEQDWIDLVWIPCEHCQNERSRLLSACWIRIHHVINHSAWPGCLHERRADHETARRQSSSFMLLILLRLRQIHWRVGTEVTTQLALAFITSRLDYCHSVVAGIPQVTLEPLQRVQNAAVQLILNLNLWDHVTPGLHQLHCWPTRWRIQYKLCSIMQSIHAGRCPVYMTECIRSLHLVPDCVQ